MAFENNMKTISHNSKPDRRLILHNFLKNSPDPGKSMTHVNIQRFTELHITIFKHEMVVNVREVCLEITKQSSWLAGHERVRE